MACFARPRSLAAIAALSLGYLAILTGCPGPQYEVTMCQTSDRIGFVAIDRESWFNTKAELHSITFNQEIVQYDEKNHPFNSRNEPLWKAESADPYQDKSHWVKGNLYYVGDVPPGWAVRLGGGPFTLSNGSLIPGETYVVEMTGKMLGKGRFRFGEDVLPTCAAVMKDK